MQPHGPQRGDVRAHRRIARRAYCVFASACVGMSRSVGVNMRVRACAGHAHVHVRLRVTVRVHVRVRVCVFARGRVG